MIATPTDIFRSCSLLLSLALILPAGAQTEPPAVLNIEVANLLIYRHDVFDATRVATEANPTTPLPLRTFMNVTWMGDIVSINGSPAKGNMTVRGLFVTLSRNPNAGTGVGDSTNSLAADWIFDIQRGDGVAVGSIMASGWAFGDRSAGLLAPGQGNIAVVGGTGAYLGVRGQGKEAGVTAGPRATASIAEDPSRRRAFGGSIRRYSLQLVPPARPRIGPTLLHPDFSPVTAENPARKGESLIAAATDLGPTVPGVEPGAAFPTETFQEVAAPVQVVVNGAAAPALVQIGWPGASATYRIDFRIPDDAPSGTARVGLVSGWIPGPEMEIPVQ
jgi:hypothetical protein